ncbi:hypothetical protein SAMN05216349_13021 [Oribacterium sp. KHPX15]|nr:hypothetical protein SAMN05216349_13021 [Oribacterium sp. KHPX15]
MTFCEAKMVAVSRSHFFIYDLDMFSVLQRRPICNNSLLIVYQFVHITYCNPEHKGLKLYMHC